MSLFSSVPLPRRQRLKSSRAFDRYLAMSPGAKVVALAVGLVIATVGVLALDAARRFQQPSPLRGTVPAHGRRTGARGHGLSSLVFCQFRSRGSNAAPVESIPCRAAIVTVPNTPARSPFLPFSSPVTAVDTRTGNPPNS